MNSRTILFDCGCLIFSCLLLSGCVQAPIFKGGDYAIITSNYPIVNINNIDVEDTYSMDIEAGENTLVIAYHTYQYDYFCVFSWTAVSGTVYEVTDQENRYPLTLYRWVRTNSLWADRLDPVDPSKCHREKSL